MINQNQINISNSVLYQLKRLSFIYLFNNNKKQVIKVILIYSLIF